MTSTLPNNLHAELALDRARLSNDGPERSLAGSRALGDARQTARGVDPHARVESLHGVILETGPPSQYGRHGFGGAIAEEPEHGMGIGGTLSGAALIAALDREEEEDIGTQRAVMHEAEWYEERSPTSSSASHFSNMQDQASYQQQQHQPQQTRSFAPRQSSLNSNAQPQSILQSRTTTLSPPPRTSSSSATSAPAPHIHIPIPISAPAAQQSFPERPRFALTDGGPVSAPPSPSGSEHGHGLGLGGPGEHPAVRRAVSDSHPHSHSEPSSPGLGVTPPMRRGGARTAPGTPKYATFEEMGIRGKGVAEAQAEKDARDCVIM